MYHTHDETWFTDTQASRMVLAAGPWPHRILLLLLLLLVTMKRLVSAFKPSPGACIPMTH